MVDDAAQAAMFRFDDTLTVLLHRDPVDGRLGINGLAALVEHTLGLDPFSPTVYVFSNKRRDRIKLLLWERSGFWVLHKRLETDRFAWPATAATLTLTTQQLHWLLEGFDLSAMRGHPARHYQRVS